MAERTYWSLWFVFPSVATTGRSTLRSGGLIAVCTDGPEGA
jgi:hypothetical protein